jgi:hypothetical protein
MKPFMHPFRRILNWTITLVGVISLVSLASLFLAGRLAVEQASADSGGFPTPTPTATFIPRPTLMPTPTPTFIPLPTQASAAQKSLADSPEAQSEAAAAPVNQAEAQQVQSQQPAESSTGMSSFSRFFIGFLIGLAILGLVWLVYKMLQSTGVIH